MTNSRQKGARGERELAGILRAHGFKRARRGQQYSGANGDADVVGLPGIHIECKRVERLNIYDAIDQAKRDAKDGEFPVTAHRKNNSEWLLTMTLENWLEIYKEWYNSTQEPAEDIPFDYMMQPCKFCGSLAWETRGALIVCKNCGAIKKKPIKK